MSRRTRIGIIVYSQTGNTRQVTDRLAARLETAGHVVEILPITVRGDTQSGVFELIDPPVPEGYDGYIFAGQVQAFALSRVMKRYMTGLSGSVAGPVAIVVTEHFPRPWMGGNRAVKAIARELERVDADVRGSMIVHWSRNDRDQQITEGIERLAGIFS